MAFLGTVTRGQTNRFRIQAETVRDNILVLFKNDYCAVQFTAIFFNENPECEEFTLIDIVEVGNATGTVDHLLGRISLVTRGTWDVEIYAQDSYTNLVTSLADEHLMNGKIQVRGQANGVAPSNPSKATVIDDENINSPILLGIGEQYTCLPVACPDVDVTVNGTAYGSGPSGGTFNVEVVDQDDTPVGSLNVGGKWEVESTGRGYNYGYATGQTDTFVDGDDGYMLANLWSTFTADQLSGVINPIDPSDRTKVLNTNAFGTLERFTTTAGVAAISTDIYIIDHHTGLMVYNVLGTQNDFADAMNDSLGTDFGGPANFGGYTDWFAANLLQITILSDYQSGSPRTSSPLVNLTSDRWTSTTFQSNNAFAFYVRQDGQMRVNNKTTTTNIEPIIVRKYY